MSLTRPDDAIAEIDERDLAVRALAGLSERQRAAVVLTDLPRVPLRGGSFDAGHPASTLRMHVSRAHANLKETMRRD